MKTWILICKTCDKKKRFSGPDLGSIVEAYQTAGWYLHHHVNICPACLPITNTDLNNYRKIKI